MKRQLLLLSLIFLCSSRLLAQTTTQLDEKNGFKDLKLGSTYESLKKMLSPKPLSSNKKEKMVSYIVTAPGYSAIGEAKFDFISVDFFDGKLKEITLYTEGYMNSMKLLSILQKGYGVGEKDNPYIDDYEWHGQKVSLSFSLDNIQKEATATFNSLEISRQKIGFIDQLNKKAASEL